MSVGEFDDDGGAFEVPVAGVGEILSEAYSRAVKVGVLSAAHICDSSGALAGRVIYGVEDDVHFMYFKPFLVGAALFHEAYAEGA